MEKYDPFMELHVGLYTSDIDSYIAAFKAADVPTFASTFEDPTTQTTYYSILVQVATLTFAEHMHICSSVTTGCLVLDQVLSEPKNQSHHFMSALSQSSNEEAE